MAKPLSGAAPDGNRKPKQGAVYYIKTVLALLFLAAIICFMLFISAQNREREKRLPSPVNTLIIDTVVNGGITYLVFTGNGRLQVVNYTQDSLNYQLCK